MTDTVTEATPAEVVPTEVPPASVVTLGAAELLQLRDFIHSSIQDAIQADRVANTPAATSAPDGQWEAVMADQSSICPTCKQAEMIWVQHRVGQRDMTRKGCANKLCPAENRPAEEYLPRG